MNEQQNIRTRNEAQFREIAIRVLEKAGFSAYVPEKKLFQSAIPQGLLKKDGYIYCLETFHSRREMYTSHAILNTAEDLIRQAKKWRYIPLIVVGGVLSPSLYGDILGKSIRVVILDIQNLLYVAWEDRDLYDELVAQLPYAPDGLKPREPDFLPLPDWNAAYAGKNDWQISAAALRPDYGATVAPPAESGASVDDLSEVEWEDFWDSNAVVIQDPEEDDKPIVWPTPDSATTIDAGSSTVDLSEIPKDEGNADSGYHVHGNPGTGKSSSATLLSFLYLQNEAKKLKKDMETWKGGKETSSAAYEKLCTRTLMRLFADDLTLWKEQAKSNSDLFRFDLICKIKRDNHKDFWEMAERYFGSKYIIFEFKNYSGKVTQKEVYTTVRYLYTKAMRGVAILISPNGMDENGGKAIRGVLRDEGKLILSLTNDDLIHMLQMKEYGEDPADYLSDKLDELLIDLEK